MAAMYLSVYVLYWSSLALHSYLSTSWTRGSWLELLSQYSEYGRRHAKRSLINGLSRCHTKRRMGARGRAHPSFGMTPTFSIFFFWRKKIWMYFFFWKVGVVPKEGWVVWHLRRALGTFSCNATHIGNICHVLVVQLFIILWAETQSCISSLYSIELMCIALHCMCYMKAKSMDVE